jgi:hypothetical protein
MRLQGMRIYTGLLRSYRLEITGILVASGSRRIMDQHLAFTHRKRMQSADRQVAHRCALVALPHALNRGWPTVSKENNIAFSDIMRIHPAPGQPLSPVLADVNMPHGRPVFKVLTLNDPEGMVGRGGHFSHTEVQTY